MDFLEKIRKQPESTRRIIFWSVIVAVGAGLLGFWLYFTDLKLKSFQEKKTFDNINLPDLQEELQNSPVEIPSVETLPLTEEELEELEKLLQEAEQQ